AGRADEEHAVPDTGRGGDGRIGAVGMLEAGGPGRIAAGVVVRDHIAIAEAAKDAVAGNRDTADRATEAFHGMAGAPPQRTSGGIDRIRVLGGGEVERSGHRYQAAFE